MKWYHWLLGIIASIVALFVIRPNAAERQREISDGYRKAEDELDQKNIEDKAEEVHEVNQNIDKAAGDAKQAQIDHQQKVDETENLTDINGKVAAINKWMNKK